MKKQIILRGLLGVPIGISIGFIITIIVSFFVGKGVYCPATPEFIKTMGNELNAVVLQTVLLAIMGAGIGMASVIWELDSWSLAKQSGIYFLILCLVMLPVAYVANWMRHSVSGVLIYTGVFVAVFVIVWLVRYFIWKGRIKKLNALVKNAEKSE